MALSVSVLDGLLQTNLQSRLAPYNFGVPGISFTDFTHAVAFGIVTNIVGSTFITVDTGSVAGSGVGAGVGIVGLNQAALSSLIYANCSSLWGTTGVRLQDFTDAIAQSVVTHLLAATLTSTHSPVYAGTGVVSFALSSMNQSAMASSIQNANTFNGPLWSRWCTAIANGVVSHIKSVGTGIVTITGSGSGGSGSGSGTGVVS